MNIVLQNNPIGIFPKVHKGDLIITNEESEHKGSYYWSDAQCVEVQKSRLHGLQVEIDRETGGLRVLEDFPPEEPLELATPPAPHPKIYDILYSTKEKEK